MSSMVAELINENRKLRREIAKLTERSGSAATKTVKRGLRSVSKRVQKARPGAAKGEPRKAAVPAKSRRTKPARTTTRRKPGAGRKPVARRRRKT